ncbi:MAG: hypothetical protein A4E60_01310 [Syntrophorhabdus sp. PtaB.Bin047]|nr:MAG: hypothetical protein A4E60_01310 [Syntrophorhabdus sp. PtaB.Bin047]
MMDRIVRVVVVICTLAVAFSLFYYFVIFLPSEKRAERDRATRERQEAELQRAKDRKGYEQCRGEALATYASDWDRACQAYGKPKDCGLPRHSSERLDRLLREAREECFRKFLYGK